MKEVKDNISLSYSVESTENDNIEEGSTFRVIGRRFNEFTGVTTLECELIDGDLGSFPNDTPFQLRRSPTSEKWTRPSADRSGIEKLTLSKE